MKHIFQHYNTRFFVSVCVVVAAILFALKIHNGLLAITAIQTI